MSRSLLRNLAALASGVLFGLGLSLAQMTNPDKVLNFLDISGSWDPSLLLVLGGAVVLSALVFHFIFFHDFEIVNKSTTFVIVFCLFKTITRFLD